MAPASSAPHTREPASPARPNAPATSSPAVDVTAITTRDDFLLELGQTLGGQAAVRPVESIEAALPHLSVKRRGQVLVIDARSVADLRVAGERAHREAPHAVLLVFTEASAEAATASALKGSKVFAVLPLPVETRKTQAVFDGAVAEARTRRENATPAASAPPAAPAAAAPAADLSIGALRPAAARTAAATAGAGDDGGPARSKLVFIGVALAAVAAVAAAAAWYFLSNRPAAPVTPVASAPAANPAAPPAAPAAGSAADDLAAPVADTSVVTGKVDDLLEKARLAMHERRYAEPTGDNALLYYRSVMAEDPNNGEGRDGLQRVAAVLGSRFEEALNAGRFDEAASNLANLRVAVPGDPKVAAYTQRLAVGQFNKAMSDGNYDRAAALAQRAQQSGAVPAEQIARWRADLARHQEDAKVQHLAGLAADRIRDGKLDDVDDSARSYTQQLVALAPANPATQRATHDLIAAYLHKAQLAKGPEQDRWLNDARAAGMKPAEFAAFQRDLASSRARAAQAENDRLLGLARDRLAAGALTDPAQDSAAWYVTQLQASAPGDPQVSAVSAALAGKLLDRARTAIGAGKAADADLTAARRFGADAASVASVQQLANAPKAAPAPAASPAMLAAKLKQTRMVNPEYPPNALKSKVAGAVTLSYTVDKNGATRDIKVLEAAPPGVFDDAAVDAVKRWRYAPLIVDGTAVEVPVKMRVKFDPPK